MDALPIEVRQALERRPALVSVADLPVLGRSTAQCVLRLLESCESGSPTEACAAAAELAAVSIRLVECLTTEGTA